MTQNVSFYVLFLFRFSSLSVLLLHRVWDVSFWAQTDEQVVTELTRRQTDRQTASQHREHRITSGSAESENMIATK